MRYILFDLDGTILNTRDGIVTCIQKALARVGIEVTDLTLLERHIGPPLKEGFEFFYSMTSDMADVAVQEYRKEYKQIGLKGTTLYGGIEQCLQTLKQQGYHLIVATSKPEKVAKEFLHYFKLDHYFDDICGSTEDGAMPRLTKADVIQYCILHNHIPPDADIIMVGDRKHDVEGAKRCNIPCIGVLYGFGSEEELMRAGAIYVVEHPMALVEYITNSIKN